MPGYPIELDLRGRTALVVGFGGVGRRKASGLVGSGARVVAVDPDANGADVDGVIVRVEPYRAEHLDGVSLAFAAATPEVNARVVADAKRLGLWVTSASEPTAGDFSVPATWRAGNLTLTVSTSGASPALAAALRDKAAESIGPHAAGLAAVFAEARPVVLARVLDPEARRGVFMDWGDPRWLELFADGGEAAVLDEVRCVIDKARER